MKNEYIRVRLDSLTRAHLVEISSFWDMSMSEIVRLLVNLEYERCRHTMAEVRASVVPFPEVEG